MMRYTAANGHLMVAVSTHTDREGREVPDYWNAAHAATCPCMTVENGDW